MGNTKKLPAAAAAPEPDPEMVRLYSKDVGYQDFTPAHAKALLAYQESKGYIHWGPAAESPTESA